MEARNVKLLSWFDILGLPKDIYIEDPATKLEKIRHFWREINIVTTGLTSIEPNNCVLAEHVLS
jgi:hypothetical protein